MNRQKEYIVSIIMPTYNSERTLERSLCSIRNQSLEQDAVEILILDGGSTDRTKEIAEKYGAIFLENKKRLPEFAKQIGLLEAKGKYGIFIDSDESFKNSDSLRRRIAFLEQHPDIKNLVSSGQVCVEGEKGINRYANYIGDPFSNYVYRYDGYNRISDMTRMYTYKKEGEAFLFTFAENEALPLFDALGNMFEIEAARRIYYETEEDKSFAANIFSNMVGKTGCAAMLENDYICHDPGLTVPVYLRKLRWRVKNNLFQKEGVGFRERSKGVQKLKKRQMKYVLYCLLVIPVLADSVRMAVTKRDSWFILHMFFAEYVFVVIAWYMFLKIIKFPVKMEAAYGRTSENETKEY